ncbi:hypothetical protein DFR50_1456 [Roseiarcus fermentans]|uniref:YlxR domain-containing protein n=1 Tax=Roseiarcus fermentans TaxID=1473586 RepID=A0A366ELI4_9HYPH|nr:RNA-binding protein [Roseiarcus fermentans]RBP03253.1 hypothetical protein DFR50_1456 [Roseiarcus fermentans]
MSDGLRTSARDEEGGSERTCIVTGAKGPPEAMLRFALAPDGSVVPDIRRKLPGRGVWTSLSAEAVRRAAAKGAFARGFRAPAAAPPDLADAVDGLLERDALQSLSMAVKAGLVVSGAFKVDAAIAAGGLAALIQAADAAADGAAKREQALRSRLGEAAAAVARIKLFSSRQLDLALGKANVVHAALKSGAAASAFLARAERLRRFRAGAAEQDPNEGGGDALAASPAASGRSDELAEKPTN